MPSPFVRLLGVAFLLLAASACSWQYNKDVTLNQEGWRTNMVVSRPNSDALLSFRNSQGAGATANLVAGLVQDVAIIDRIYCPAGGIPGCDTTSEYIRSHPSDLSDALYSRRWPDCLALTLLPPYNWTTKGPSNGCFG